MKVRLIDGIDKVTFIHYLRPHACRALHGHVWERGVNVVMRGREQMNVSVNPGTDIFATSSRNPFALTFRAELSR